MEASRRLNLPAEWVRRLKVLGVRCNQDLLGSLSMDLACDLRVDVAVVEGWKMQAAVEELSGCNMMLPSPVGVPEALYTQQSQIGEDTNNPSMYNLPFGLTAHHGGVAGEAHDWFPRPIGCRALDRLLYTPTCGGGLPAGRVIELIGAPGSGRTQVVLSSVCACACSNVAVLLIDTCNGITSSHLTGCVAKTLQASSSAHSASVGGTQVQVQRERYEQALSLITMERCFTLHQLLSTLGSVAARGGRSDLHGGKLYGLVVVDCLHALMLPMQVGPVSIPGLSAGAASAATAATNPLTATDLINSVSLALKGLTARGSTVLFTSSKAITNSGRGGRSSGGSGSGGGGGGSFGRRLSRMGSVGGGSGSTGGSSRGVSGQGHGAHAVARDAPLECFSDTLVDVILEIATVGASDTSVSVSALADAEQRNPHFQVTVRDRPWPFKIKDPGANKAIEHHVKVMEGQGEGNSTRTLCLTPEVFNPAQANFRYSDLFSLNRGGGDDDMDAD